MEAEVRKQDGSVISEKRDVTIVDTANPFGNLAEIDIEDDGGELYDEFPYGTRVEIFVRDLFTDFELDLETEEDLTIESNETLVVEDNETRTQRVITNAGILENQGIVKTVADPQRPDFQQRFAGYVVERDDQNENSGRDNLQLTVYSFDQLLRADSVSNDQTGHTITEALEDIITEDTAVTWNPENVDVVDEQELTESLQGEKVEDALLKLSKKSVDEEFGVNDDVEFFFRQQEPVSAPSDITDSDWIDYQLPERGEENKNESRTYFNSDGEDNSDRVAVVDDGVSQLELQESLGTEDPVIIADDRDRNDLNDVDDAAEDSEQNLDDKEVARVYEFVAEAEDFLTAEPGQVFDVEIQAAGIDGEFRIAELEYRDVGSTVRITAIRNKGNTDDVLRRVTERLRRKELETADFDGPEDRINIAEVGVEIADSLTVDGTTWDRTRVTNTLRNQIRDGWGGRGNVNVSEIAVGTDASNLSRTNESLENQVATASVTETLDGSFAVDYDASVSESDIQEVGLLDGSGNLLFRAVNDTAASPGDISLTLTVNNNPEIPKAVVTDIGRESIRDIIADNNPELPVNYGFGSDQTEPSTADTTLGNSVFVADLTETIIENLSTQIDWEEYVTTEINDSIPLKIENGIVTTKQSCFHRSANDDDGFNIVSGGDINTESDEDTAVYEEGRNNGFYINLLGEGTWIEYDITPTYTIPNEHLEFYYRVRNEDVDTSVTQDVIPTLNGDAIDFQLLTLQDINRYIWETNDPEAANWEFNDDLEAGETYTLRFEVAEQDDDDSIVDINSWAIADSRFNQTADNDLDENNVIDGPETHPDVVEVDFAETSTRRAVDSANVESVWVNNDVGEEQFIELSNDGGENYTRTNNSEMASANFAELNRGVRERVGISRRIEESEASPKFDAGQGVDVWDLFANPDAVIADGLGTALTIGIVPRNEIVGSTISELGQLDANENTLTRSIRAELEVEQEMRVFGRERLQITQA